MASTRSPTSKRIRNCDRQRRNVFLVSIIQDRKIDTVVSKNTLHGNSRRPKRGHLDVSAP